ncbi:MAG: hypothetical protein WAO31_00745 [Rhodoluna sp.]
MKILALSLASVFLLTGCSVLGGDESDAAACEELALVVSATEVSLDSLNPTAIAETLRSKVEPLAGEGLAPRIDELATALEGAEIDTAAAGAAASAIGVQCMLSGVMFDFTGIGQLLQ